MIKHSARKLTMLAMLSAVSTVLMFFDFPLPIFPSFLQIDLSDLPAIIAAFSFGPIAGAVVELIKNLIHLTQTSTGGVGELANFLVGAALCVTAGIIYKSKKSRRDALIGMGAGIVAMAVVAGIMNYFVMIPLYTKLFMPLETIIGMCSAIFPAIDSLAKVVLFSVIPFNIFKGVIVCAITYLVYKRISGFLHGRR
jgi:riboflavin transporter FmnP